MIFIGWMVAPTKDPGQFGRNDGYHDSGLHGAHGDHHRGAGCFQRRGDPKVDSGTSDFLDTRFGVSLAIYMGVS